MDTKGMDGQSMVDGMMKDSAGMDPRMMSAAANGRIEAAAAAIVRGAAAPMKDAKSMDGKMMMDQMMKDCAGTGTK